MGRDSGVSIHVRLLQEVVRIMQDEPAYRPAARRIRAAERRYARTAADKAERSMMHAQVAKLLLYTAIDKGAAFQTVERRFREVLALPCHDPTWKVEPYIEFALFCGSQGRTSAGIRLLEQFAYQEGSVSKRVLSYCRAQVARAMRQLREGQAPSGEV